MVRKLALAVSLAVGTLPLSVYALGLGEIKTSSALNEKFEAEIELLSVKKGELDTLRVGLAPAEVFAQTGVERPFLLSRLKFKPVRTRDGRAVIRVTSDMPIREPFLDFFVQVAWPKGQLVREYTVLLDPPVLTKRQAPRVTAPAASAGRKPARKVQRHPEVMPGGEYGPVRANEALWNIADRLRPAGVSIHQMMVALYKANPEAFLNGDINLLKKGMVLQVPEEDEIRSLGRRQAVAEFARLSEGWIRPAATPPAAARQTAAADEAPAEPAPAVEEAASAQARLKIAGADEKAVAEPGAGAGGAQDADAEALRQKLLLVEEEAATARQEAENLRQRMDAMEARLAEMSRLLKLKDEELAQLQAAAGGAAVAAGVAGETETPAGTEEIQPEAVAAEEKTGMTGEEGIPSEAAPETAAGEEITAAETLEETASGEAAAVVETVAETPVPAATEEPAPAVPEEAAPAEKVVAVAPEPAPAPAAAGTEAWTQWLTDNWKLVAGGGGALLLALIGIGVARRRREPEAVEVPPSASATQPVAREESILADEDTLALQQGADSTMGDTSFLSEYSTEELRALNEDTVEVDPVSEADVYIAYGRYSQAEEILREAMENGDDSAAVRHKMLEVYYATQKKDEFRKLVEEMQAAGQDKEDPKGWEHIMTMGRDLDRNNPLFAAAAAAGALGSQLQAPAEADEESELALDLSTLAEEVDSALNPESEQVDSFSSLDLELPSLQIEPGEQRASNSAPSTTHGEPDKLDLEVHETELHTELADLTDLGDLGIESNMLDDTLTNLADDLEGVMGDSQDILGDSAEVDDSLFSSLESPTSVIPSEELSGEEAPGQTLDEEDSIIGDEVETKLELAKAFMEIGDADGARSILHEVQEDGTAEQKEMAAGLLAQLDG